MIESTVRISVREAIPILMMFFGVYLVCYSLAGFFGVTPLDYDSFILGGLTLSLAFCAKYWIAKSTKQKTQEEEE